MHLQEVALAAARRGERLLARVRRDVEDAVRRVRGVDRVRRRAGLRHARRRGAVRVDELRVQRQPRGGVAHGAPPVAARRHGAVAPAGAHLELVEDAVGLVEVRELRAQVVVDAGGVHGLAGAPHVPGPAAQEVAGHDEAAVAVEARVRDRGHDLREERRGVVLAPRRGRPPRRGVEDQARPRAARRGAQVEEPDGAARRGVEQGVPLDRVEARRRDDLRQVLHVRRLRVDDVAAPIRHVQPPEVDPQVVRGQERLAVGAHAQRVDVVRVLARVRRPRPGPGLRRAADQARHAQLVVAVLPVRVLQARADALLAHGPQLDRAVVRGQDAAPVAAPAAELELGDLFLDLEALQEVELGLVAPERAEGRVARPAPRVDAHAAAAVADAEPRARLIEGDRANRGVLVRRRPVRRRREALLDAAPRALLAAIGSEVGHRNNTPRSAIASRPRAGRI
ncbi:unnamed protein product [Pelagomonas calceolata]|uniref:Uncharacterized protein n=1 Tax=Pelagomonas calceolata TaxID=35677 RepID=A0A8J2SMN0_9STRA|nr:unnamed protein product [Pelagomonas calceolata]